MDVEAELQAEGVPLMGVDAAEPDVAGVEEGAEEGAAADVVSAPCSDDVAAS